MSEEKINEPETASLAKLEDDEVLISPTLIEKYKEAVEELNEKNKAFDDADIAESESKDESEDNVIGSPKTESSDEPTKPSIVSDKDGIVSSTKADKPSSSKKNNAKSDQPKKETVAIFSSRNVTWSEVGKVYRGYNIVTKEAADKWLTRDHIRLATPQEIAEEFKR